jgi:hypothetical protein
LQAKSKAVYNAMVAAETTFTAPNPPMPTLLLLIQALDAAQEAVATKGKGLVAARNLKANALISGLESERSYVQALVDANPEQGQALAELASMGLAKVRTRTKPLLALALVMPSGTVAAKANLSLLTQGRGKGKKTTINWRCSSDGGQIYSSHSTPLAHTTFTGLTPMSTVAAQVCITDANGTTDWSQPVSILVR